MTNNQKDRTPDERLRDRWWDEAGAESGGNKRRRARLYFAKMEAWEVEQGFRPAPTSAETVELFSTQQSA